MQTTNKNTRMWRKWLYCKICSVVHCIAVSIALLHIGENHSNRHRVIFCRLHFSNYRYNTVRRTANLCWQWLQNSTFLLKCSWLWPYLSRDACHPITALGCVRPAGCISVFTPWICLVAFCGVKHFSIYYWQRRFYISSRSISSTRLMVKLEHVSGMYQCVICVNRQLCLL